jgi:hypothetical protein
VLRRTIALVVIGLWVLGMLWLAGVRLPGSSPTLTGVVVDPRGAPVGGATVSTEDGTETVTARDGTFSLAAPASWLTVRAKGWLPRSRVGAPGDPVVVRLLRDQPGTVTLAFAGDVMFGRRFFDPDGDGSMRGLLSPASSVAEHLALLHGVAPLLRDADLTEVNLEGPLTNHPYPDPRQPRPRTWNPTSEYVFASAPVAADALAEAGVDVVGMANNHVYDHLAAGVRSTIASLQSAGFGSGRGFFGAGSDAGHAWRPAVRRVAGQRIAFLGCTTVTGAGHKVTFVATRHKAGAAACTSSGLRAAVRRAGAQGAFVVVSVHGGIEYDGEQTSAVRHLSDVAFGAGATVVVNGHPHVVSGIRFDQGRITAWTMGNLIFDQTLSSTFSSYVLEVALRHGHVVGAWAEPFRIDHRLPTGLSGADADWVAREARSLSEGPWVDDDGSLWLDIAGASRVVTEDGDPGLVRIDRGCATGAGRELLWTGDFETRDLLPGMEPRQWNLTADDPYRRAVHHAAHEGRTGILLHRASSEVSDVILMPLHRSLVGEGDRLTLLVDLRSLHGDPAAALQLSWYNDTRGPSQARTRVAVPVTAGWESWRVDVVVPRNAVAARPLVRLRPPGHGVSQLAVDNVRLVDWDRAGCDYAQDGQPVFAVTLRPEVSGPLVTPVQVRTVAASAPARIPGYRGIYEE